MKRHDSPQAHHMTYIIPGRDLTACSPAGRRTVGLGPSQSDDGPESVAVCVHL